MTPFERHIQAAVGYHELGLPLEALDELAQLGAEAAARSEVLTVRVVVLQTLGMWDQMETAARTLCERQPDEGQWPISLAYAIRRAHSLPEALIVLEAAAERFPEEAIIHFNLACYHAQLGDLETARRRLREAVRLDPVCQKMAQNDPDLLPLR